MRDFSADVTAVILTRDEEANIGRTLGQLTWAADVVVVDSISRDNTVAIAKSFPNVRVFERPFDDLAQQWTFAIAQVQTQWALTLDADYFVPEEFVGELRALEPPPDVAAYDASFVYAINGRRLRGSLYPPRPVLLRTSRCSFRMDGHAQRSVIDGRVLKLREPLVHDDRKPFSRFVQRQRKYMTDEAEKIRRGENLNLAGRVRKMRVVAPLIILPHVLLGRGLILDGRAGLRYAWERFVAELMLSRELLFGSRKKPSAADVPQRQ